MPSFQGKSFRILQDKKIWYRKGDFHQTYVLPFSQIDPHLSQYPLLLSTPEIKAAVFPMNILPFTSITFPTTDLMILTVKNDDP